MKFYKITNEEECHHDLQYHDGLVEDIKPFNPSGDCTPGGIYFAREDILFFLNYGPWIREVTIPPGAQIYKNPGKPEKWKADKVYLHPRRRLDTAVIRELLAEGADPKVGASLPLMWASSRGWLDLVKILLPVSDPLVSLSETLRTAVEYGHLDIVKFLLPYSDPKAIDSLALRMAVSRKRIDIVKLLLPHSDPTACNSQALRLAVENGCQVLVDLLLPVSDITYWSSAMKADLEKYRRLT